MPEKSFPEKEIFHREGNRANLDRELPFVIFFSICTFGTTSRVLVCISKFYSVLLSPSPPLLSLSCFHRFYLVKLPFIIQFSYYIMHICCFRDQLLELLIAHDSIYSYFHLKFCDLCRQIIKCLIYDSRLWSMARLSICRLFTKNLERFYFSQAVLTCTVKTEVILWKILKEYRFFQQMP